MVIEKAYEIKTKAVSHQRMSKHVIGDILSELRIDSLCMVKEPLIYTGAKRYPCCGGAAIGCGVNNVAAELI